MLCLPDSNGFDKRDEYFAKQRIRLTLSRESKTRASCQAKKEKQPPSRHQPNPCKPCSQHKLHTPASPQICISKVAERGKLQHGGMRGIG